MAADFIDVEPFFELTPLIPFAQAELQEITYPPVDGRAHRKLGVRSEIITISGEQDVLDPGIVALKMQAFRSWIGTFRSVTQRGMIFSEMLVKHVRIPSLRPIENPIGGFQVGSGYIMTVQFTLVYPRSGNNVGT